MKMKANALARLRSFGEATSGLALLEFAFTLPIVLTMSLTGAELTNYITTRMRISQIALQTADNAARIGSGSQLEAKKITEVDINDLFAGAGLQGGELDLLQNGRIFLSSLESDPNNAGKYTIRWQRCAGVLNAHASSFGVEGDANLTGMGPAPQIIAPVNGVTMFAEIQYQYTPLIRTSLSPSRTMREVASMMVRDRRDTSDDTRIVVNGVEQNNPNPRHPKGVYKVDGIHASTCTPSPA